MRRTDGGDAATELAGPEPTEPEVAGPEPTEPEIELEDEDFYEGFEGEPDLFDRGSRRGSGRFADDGTTGERSAAARDPEKVTYANLPRSVKVGVVLALIVGVLGGIYVAGSSRSSDPFAGQTMPEGHPDISQMGSAAAGAEGQMQSIAELTAAVERDPDDVDARLDLGVAYFNLDELESAREQWEAVLDINPDNVPALYSMGFYYLSLLPQDTDAAYEVWGRVVQLDPESVEAMNIQAHMSDLESGSLGTQPPAGH